MAYAGCLDSEPHIPPKIKPESGKGKYKAGSFKQVELTNMRKHWDDTTLGATHIYSSDFKKLSARERKLPFLCKSSKCK